MNSKQLTLDNSQVDRPSKRLRNLSMLALPKLSTGGLKMLWLPSEIKEPVDHAGLLELLLLMKAIKYSSKELIFPSTWVSSKLSIVQLKDPMIIMGAMEVMLQELWDTSRTMDRPLKRSIPTKLWIRTVLRILESGRLSELLKFQDAHQSKRFSESTLLQWELMLPTGISTRMVFLTIALLTSITPSSWLDHQMMLGPSRTAGEGHGEKTDTSD